MCVMVNDNTKRLGQQYSAQLRWGLSTSAHLNEFNDPVSRPGRPDVYSVQLIMNQTSKKTNGNNMKIKKDTYKRSSIATAMHESETGGIVDKQI